MKFDIYKVTPSRDVYYLGFKFFETRPNKGDIISFMNHDYRVLESSEYYLCVKQIS